VQAQPASNVWNKSFHTLEISLNIVKLQSITVAFHDYGRQDRENGDWGKENKISRSGKKGMNGHPDSD
jgi:hypothetical protein